MSEPEKKKKNFLQRAISWLTDLFKWIVDQLEDSEVRKTVLTDLGLSPDASEPLKFDKQSLDSIERYRSKVDPDAEALKSALKDLATIYDSLKTFIEANGGAAEGVDILLSRFMELMTLNYLRLRNPLVYFIAQPIGFIQEPFKESTAGKTTSERIVSFFSDIGGHFKEISRELDDKGRDVGLDTEEQARAWSDMIFFPVQIALAVVFGSIVKSLPYGLKYPSSATVTDFYYGWEPEPASKTPISDQISDRTLSFGLKLTKKDAASGGVIEKLVNTTMMLVPRVHGGPGVFIAFGGGGEVTAPLSDDWSLKVEIISDDAIDFLIKLDDVKTKAGSDARAVFTVEARKDELNQPYIVGNTTGTRLEFGRLAFSGEISSDGAGIKFLAQESALVIDAEKDADGFIKETMPDKETRIDFNLGLGLSSSRGLYLEGGTGLKSVIPIAKSIGPVNIQFVTLGLTPNSAQGKSEMVLEAAAAFDAKIGGFRATVDQLGFKLTLDFAKQKPNLSFADLSFGFKPPTGIGLSIDTETINGGGFLLLDPDKGQYAGMIHLSWKCGLALKAIGLLNTRLPNNQPGYSLVVMITVEGFKWYPLGMGFAITGVGGLLGINRTVSTDALKAGLKNHTLDHILFPKDPIRDAPAILATLGTVFPMVKGHHFAGFALQIVWGAKQLVTSELMFILEFGEQKRLVILGQIFSILPTEKADLVRFKMDVVGVIDFNREMASIDARLFDSRLARSFTISGEMAMRASWGQNPSFALAIGGMHPDFPLPSGFPKLARISINLSTGDNPRIRCEAYFAITSNTLQFGARCEVFAKVSKFSIEGLIAFDVLIQFDPFAFIASFEAMVQLKAFSKNLFKIRFKGEMSGPRPLRVRGKATFEIFWCDFSVSFDKTLVKGERPPSPEAIDVAAMLVETLRDPASWSAVLAAGDDRLVTLQEVARAGEVVLHPLSKLVVRQTIAPLNREINHFGGARPSGAKQFAITQASINNQAKSVAPVTEYFAPAQFFDLSDADKLSSPSFELMAAGAQIGSDEPAFGAPIKRDLSYEEIVFDPETKDSVKSQESYKLTMELLTLQARFGSAAVSDVRRKGAEKYRFAQVAVTVDEPRYTLASVENLSASTTKEMTFTEAKAALIRMQREDPSSAKLLQVVAKSIVK